MIAFADDDDEYERIHFFAFYSAQNPTADALIITNANDNMLVWERVVLRKIAQASSFQVGNSPNPNYSECTSM